GPLLEVTAERRAALPEERVDPAGGVSPARAGDLIYVATPRRKRPLVLVVEDGPALGDVMLTALKDDGLDAKLAHDGDEAMRDVDALSPAAMVLDLMMPKRAGFSVLRELRADGRISHIPVIVVTAIFGMSERLYATELGAADYVTKPFELDDLVSRVRALLSPTAA